MYATRVVFGYACGRSGVRAYGRSFPEAVCVCVLVRKVLKERLRKQDKRKQLLYEIKTANELLDGTTLSVAERIKTSGKLNQLKLELENLH